MPEALPELDFEASEKQILACIKNSQGMARQCAHHAILHLERAWRLSKIDPEMAVFRAITAEEEAATALLVILRERKYVGIERKHFYSHTYKQGVLPFIVAVRKFVMGLSPLPEMRLKVATEADQKRLYLQLRFAGHAWGEPQPPFGFELTDENSGLPVDFSNELEQLANEAGRKEILDHIRNRAGLRNRLLYADYDGMPKITQPVDKELAVRRTNVFLILTVFCLLAPYREQAVFMQQAINAFLKAMRGVNAVANETATEPADEVAG